MFLLKKIVGALLQPLPISLALLFAGVFFLWRRKASRWGRILTTAGTVLLFLASLKAGPYVLGRMLEGVYPAYSVTDGRPAPTYIVVLGGGSLDDASLPLSARLDGPALARIVEGVRLAKLHPQAPLVVSGGPVYSSTVHAEVLSSVALLLGVDSSRVMLESRSRDTHDQAVLVEQIVGAAPFALVTSATHMPRSMALFRKRGMHPIAAPTGHLYEEEFATGPRAFIPAAEHLRNLEFVVHELLGLAWARLRGQV